MGIFFAFLALFAWGVGDFLIQKSVRKFSTALTIFYITAFGAIALFPFVYKDISQFIFSGAGFWVVFAASATILLAAVLNLEALKVGKISVIEPIFAFEVPVTALWAAAILREYPTGPQLFLIFLLLIGIILLTTGSFSDLKKIKPEKGVWLAVFSMFAMGTANFLMGFGSRLAGPLMENWFLSVFIFTIITIYLAATGKLKEAGKFFRRDKKLVLGVVLINNLAWIFFALAALSIPIAIATGISGNFIIVAALLGLLVGREKLRPHQYLGLIFSIIIVIILAFSAR